MERTGSKRAGWYLQALFALCLLGASCQLWAQACTQYQAVIAGRAVGGVAYNVDAAIANALANCYENPAGNCWNGCQFGATCTFELFPVDYGTPGNPLIISGYAYVTFNGNTNKVGISPGAINRWSCPPLFFLHTAPRPRAVNSCPNPVADPISTSSGAVFTVEADLKPVGAGGLEFKRYFNSKEEETSSLMSGWRHSYSQSIRPLYREVIYGDYVDNSPDNSSLYYTAATACELGFAQIRGRVSTWANASASFASGSCRVIDGTKQLGTIPVRFRADSLPTPDPVVIGYEVTRESGQRIPFYLDSTGTTLEAPPGISLRLQQITGGFLLVGSDDTRETFDASGRLLTVATRAGMTIALAYDAANRLSTASDSFGHVLTLGYDGAGRLVSLTDPALNTVRYDYDIVGRLAKVTNTDLTVRTFLYNGPNLMTGLTGIQDEFGTLFSSWAYDAQGRAVSSQEAGGAGAVSLAYNNDLSVTVTDALGAGRTFTHERYGDLRLASSVSGSRCPGCVDGASTTYDDAGYPRVRFDYEGNATQTVYDTARGLETSRTEGYGTARARTVATTWHATFRLPVLITEPARSTAFTYDSHGNVLTRTVTDTLTPGNHSRTWTYSYDSYGRVLTEDGPRSDVNDVTTYTYYTCSGGGACGQVQTITDAAGHVTTFNTYNGYGDPLTVTDGSGVVSTFTYDQRRHLRTVATAGELTTLDYWPTGKLRRVVAPDDSYLLYFYDNAQRLKRVEDGEGNRIEYTLDAMGNTTEERVYDASNALSRTRSQVFDSLSQLWKTLPSAGTPGVTTSFGYDADGNLTSVAAPLNRGSEFEYDELNRLFRVTDAANGVMTIGYDADDNVSSVTDPRNIVTGYTYNGFGDRVRLDSPDTGTTLSTFDEAGNLQTSTDARGITGTRTYDTLNRLTNISFPDQSLSFSYDSGASGAGRLTGAVDAHHSLAWSYDARGRVSSQTQVVGALTRSVAYAYQNGNLSTVTTPSGQVISYGYSNGKVASVAVNGATVLNQILYDPFGPPRQWYWASGAIEVRTHDQDGLLTQLDAGGEFSEYSYDDAARVTAIDNSSQPSLSASYEYDSLDRLTEASDAARTEGWTYDASGNRLTEAGTAQGTPFSTAYSVSATSNRVSSLSGSRANAYSFDAAGNTTAETNANRAVVLDGATMVSYVYNALSQRVWKSGPGAPTYFVYDLRGHLLGEYGPGGSLIQETVWLDDLPIATLRPRAGGGVDIYYVHPDHLGTPRKVTRPQDGALVWRWESSAFGKGMPDENPQAVGTFQYNLRYPGQYFDAESGLSYNYFRDYDPSTGRYIESDPIGLNGGINTYSYGMNRPTSLSDPTGEFAIVVPGAVVATGAAAICIFIPGCIEGVKDLVKELLYPPPYPGSPASHAASVERRSTPPPPLPPSDGTSDNANCPPDDGCAEELRACSEMCSEAQTNPNLPLVFGGSVTQCIQNCLPQRCGGEGMWKGFKNSSTKPRRNWKF